MGEYNEIWWKKADARLKSYSGATRASGAAIIKIEIEVFDPARFGFMLAELAEIQLQQRAEAKANKEKAKPSAKKQLPPPPLQLTYRGTK